MPKSIEVKAKYANADDSTCLQNFARDFQSKILLLFYWLPICNKLCALYIYDRFAVREIERFRASLQEYRDRIVATLPRFGNTITRIMAPLILKRHLLRQSER